MMPARRTSDPGDSEVHADEPENLKRERRLSLIAWAVATIGLALILAVILIAR